MVVNGILFGVKTQTGLAPLSERRKAKQLCTMFKIMNDMTLEFLGNFTPPEQRLHCRLRNLNDISVLNLILILFSLNN